MKSLSSKSRSDRERFLSWYVQRLTGRTGLAASDGWQDRRFCQEDWLLNIRVQRVVARRRFEIALFLAEDHERYVRGAGVIGGLVFALSEAFEKTGNMEVHFVGPPEGGEPEVPVSIRNVAKEQFGLELPRGNRITDELGRKLYARITGLSEKATEAIRSRGIDLVKACFVIHRGLWTKDQVELIVWKAYAPERVLGGGVHAEHRLQYMHDMLLLRAALLSERLQTLCTVVYGTVDQVVNMEWLDQGAVLLRLLQPVTLPAVADIDLTIPAKTPLTATLIARDATGYEVHGDDDVQGAALPTALRTLVVTRDFEWIRAPIRKRLLARAKKAMLSIVIVTDTLGELDSEIELRLSQVASTKQGAQERPD